MPHIGCKYKCSFCDQNTITGSQCLPHEKDVINAVNEALKCHPERAGNTEVAFFGGSFTGIKREYMLELLDAAYNFVKSGKICGIRLSTRPDYIDDEILTLLKEKGVTSIELGAQSMDNYVLKANNRGHTAEDVILSSKLIKEYGFSLGLQMMTGLYKSDEEKDIYTAKAIASLSPDTVRIYPTAVIRGTALGTLYEKGAYLPPDTKQSVTLCAKLIDYFTGLNISVIRVGLHDSDSLRNDFLAGVYHPAFRELCESFLFFTTVKKAIETENIEDKELQLHINPADVSKLKGQKCENIKRLEAEGFKVKVVQDTTVDKYSIKILTEDSQKGKCYGAFKIFGNTRL